MPGSAEIAVAVILAGGRSARMGGVDKAAMTLGGVRLIDRVVARLAPQASEIVISGREDYRLGFCVVQDIAEGPSGPAAGLYAALHALAGRKAPPPGFLTAPVDAPFLPADLASRLAAGDRSAVAISGGRAHPTFAWWRLDDLAEFFRRHGGGAPALHKIAASVGATHVDFDNAPALTNLNSPEDFRAAEATLRTI